MNKFTGIVLFSVLMCTGADNKLVIPIVPQYDLRSDQAYTHYLPDRVKALSELVVREGIDGAKEALRNDEDLESYVFVLSIEKPEKIVAYSREQQFVGKTAQEIQQLIFPECATAACNVQVIFDQLRSAANKGGTYVPFLWRLDKADSEKYQVGYVQQLTLDGQDYIVGAALFVDEVPINMS